MRTVSTVILAAAGLWLAGCTTDDTRRVEGVTSYAGNAIAANTVMQMVDPWPEGVQDTHLQVPAERSAREESGGGDSDSSDTDY